MMRFFHTKKWYHTGFTTDCSLICEDLMDDNGMIWSKMKNRFVKLQKLRNMPYCNLIFSREHNLQKRKLVSCYVIRQEYYFDVYWVTLISCLLHPNSEYGSKCVVCIQETSSVMTATLMPNDKEWYFISLEILIFLEYFSAEFCSMCCHQLIKLNCKVAICKLVECVWNEIA